MSTTIRSCRQKARYPTAARALSIAAEMNRSRGANNIKAYECPICSGFHLTSLTINIHGGKVYT